MILHIEKTFNTTIQKNLSKSQKFAWKISVVEFRYSQAIFWRFAVILIIILRLIILWNFFWNFSFVLNFPGLFFQFKLYTNWSLLKLQTSHRRLTDEYRQVTDEYKRVTGELQTSTDKSQTTTDESQTTADGSQTTGEWQTSHKPLQTSHRWVTDDYDELFPNFFEYIYKTLFSERIWFPNAPMKRWFLLKKGKFKIWRLSKWRKLSYTKNQLILSF